MADKYIRRDDTTGKLTETEATDVSAGAADAGEVVALDANGLIDPSMLSNVNANITADAAVNVTAGDVVFIDAAGEVDLADADSGTAKAACGFVLSTILATNPVVVFFEGIITGLAGFTAGDRIYLDTTAGQLTSTPVTGTGNLHQYVGKALSATTVLFEPDDDIVLA